MDCELIQKYNKLSIPKMKRVILYSYDDSNNIEKIKYLDAQNDLSEEPKEPIKTYLEPHCEA